MNLTDIAKSRLINQQIERPRFRAVKELVGWMGAMQAQDYGMAKWAIGVRLPNSTEQVIETAINKGEIIRTHILRPTWHFVSADDIYWMLALRAASIKASLRTRLKQLGLTESIIAKSNTIIENELRGGKHLTREELYPELTKAGIPIDENRASHLLVRAELDGLVCSGAIKGRKQTYALLEERVPKTALPTREEALARLAKRYFNSHGPATLPDFVWWSGLSVSEARDALRMVTSDLNPEIIDAQTYWYPQTQLLALTGKGKVHFLPAFDEFTISYTDRHAALPMENFSMSVSSNGIFRPIIVVNGQVTGIWKRTIKKDKVLVETAFFQSPGNTTIPLIEKAARQYGQFLDMETEIKLS
jgi:Winged helix DNA-binding domain